MKLQLWLYKKIAIFLIHWNLCPRLRLALIYRIFALQDRLKEHAK